MQRGKFTSASIRSAWIFLFLEGQIQEQARMQAVIAERSVVVLIDAPLTS